MPRPALSDNLAIHPQRGLCFGCYCVPVNGVRKVPG